MLKTNKKLKIRFLRKLNSRGFGHHVLVGVFVVTAFASFGAYRVFTSEAAVSKAAAACKKQGGVWLNHKEIRPNHGPCWKTSGAYLVNYGTGKVGDGIDQLGSGRSETMKYPNYVVVTSGSWKVCHQQRLSKDTCSQKALKKGVYNLCSTITASTGYVGDEVTRSYKYCSKDSVYIQKL